MFKALIELAPQQTFLLQGDQQTFKSLVADANAQTDFLEQRNLSRFTVEDAQAVVSFNLEREPGAWCIVYFDIFVTDAAQVLLKTLEEPRESIYIVFITPHPYLIPQTIRSRMRLIPGSASPTIPEYFASKKILQEYIKETFGSESDEDASLRRAKATVFLDALEQYIRSSPEKASLLYEAKDMLFKANMPTKQVVEYIVSMVF